jgi:Peptidase family M1 domain
MRKKVLQGIILCACSGFVALAPIRALPQAQVQPEAPSETQASATAAWNAIAQAAFDLGKAARAENIEIARDRIHITLNSGTLQFGQPVNGLVFAAAFQGRGRVQIDPPTPQEAQQLRRLTGKDKLDMEFSNATFSFSDDTFAQLAPQLHWGAAPGDSLASLYQSRQRDREDSGAGNIPRLLQGVLSADHKRTAFFLADLKTPDKGWIQVRFDAMDIEQIEVGRTDDWGGGTGFDTWMHFPAGGLAPSDADQNSLALDDYEAQDYEINATVTAGAELSSTTKVHLSERVTGERIMRFGLDSNLRVDSVKDESGAALAYFQARERKDRNDSYGDYVAVVLPQPSEANKAITLQFHYGGKRVVLKVGNGNYFCQSNLWYPESPNTFATRANFEMTFHSPKNYILVATGSKTGQDAAGNMIVTTWKSPKPLAVAGFAYGDYKLVTDKAGDVNVEIYANRVPDDMLASIQADVDNSLPGVAESAPVPDAAVGTLVPSAMAKQMGTEVSNALKVFQAYYGPAPYDRLAVTNIPYSYGQGWPMLIYLSTLSFLDSTQRNAFGIHDQTQLTDFFRAHEVSHQWWGHRVGWKTYHDQWLSEGFAQFSGNLYTQFRENWKQYQERLRLDKQELFSRDTQNQTYESAGPIWMGERLSIANSPRSTAVVMYNKGGLVLNMLRMMLFDPRAADPDAKFKSMMQDFCATFDNKSASTEDFKAIAEKNMLPQMDLDGNQRLDWFFNQYVYGTGIAEYAFSYNVQDAGSGKWKVTGTLNRSGVPDGWKDILPIYILTGGKTIRIGWLRTSGKQTPIDTTLPIKPDKITLNDNQDILTDIKQ